MSARAEAVSKATRAQEVAMALHAVRLYGPALSDVAAVVGSHSLGLSTVAVLLARGIGRVWLVTDNEQARADALRAGAFAARVPSGVGELDDLRSEMGGYGPDIAFDCDCRSHARRLAIELVRPAGRIILVGADEGPTMMNPNLLVFGDKRVQGSGGYDHYEFKLARDMIANGVVHVFLAGASDDEAPR